MYFLSDAKFQVQESARITYVCCINHHGANTDVEKQWTKRITEINFISPCNMNETVLLSSAVCSLQCFHLLQT
jgi:hypothetical protein